MQIPDPTQRNFRFDYDGTTAVGIFPPNGYGLFDMAGNVRERRWDLTRTIPRSATPIISFSPRTQPQTDPHGPDTVRRRPAAAVGWTLITSSAAAGITTNAIA